MRKPIKTLREIAEATGQTPAEVRAALSAINTLAFRMHPQHPAPIQVVGEGDNALVTAEESFYAVGEENGLW